MLRISRINNCGIINNIIKTNHHHHHHYFHHHHRHHYVSIRNYTLKYSPPLDISETELNERLLITKKLLENYNTKEINASITSGLYTKFGWFYIPSIYNQSNKSSEIIANELTKFGATLDTPNEEIQNFIDQWCIYNLPIQPEKSTKKSKSNTVDDLFQSSINKNIEGKEEGEEEDKLVQKKLVQDKEEKKSSSIRVKGADNQIKQALKLIKQQERLNKLNIKKINQEELKISKRIAKLQSKIIVKFNENSNNYEILSKITKRHLNGYYYSKRLYELTKDQKNSLIETKKIIKQELSSMDKISLEILLNEFTQMLINGNDIYKGELIPLEKTLSEPLIDGSQIRIGIINIIEKENSSSLK